MLQATSPDATCDVCGRSFLRFSSMQRICGRMRCTLAVAKQAGKDRRADTKARKEKLKTVRDWIKETQVEFNKYIRLRDAGKPCICCGAPAGSPGAVGGGVDAGHYRSVGSASHLRFNEDNCHAQTKKCNRYGAGRAVDYRIGLLQRIGLARVEALEANNTPHKWTVEELKALKAKFRAMARELEKE